MTRRELVRNGILLAMEFICVTENNVNSTCQIYYGKSTQARTLYKTNVTHIDKVLNIIYKQWDKIPLNNIIVSKNDF